MESRGREIPARKIVRQLAHHQFRYIAHSANTLTFLLPLKSASLVLEAYRVELAEERLTAQFTSDSIMELTPDLVGATKHKIRGLSETSRS